MFNRFKKIHLIGIGGIGMSGLAELLFRNGYSVTGSDVKSNDSIKSLEKENIPVFIGHSPENIGEADLVVYSSAVKESNPEIIKAKEKEIPIIPRAEMLAELMRLKYGIAVAGAHGKTTTTSMVSLALMEGNLDPTIVVGGKMDNFGGKNTRLGTGEFMVVEADESDGSFNKLSPTIAIVTNIDREHMDHYKSMSVLKNAFLSFLNKVPFYGLCVICGDDPYLKTLSPKITRRKKTYGFEEHNHYQIVEYGNNGTSRVKVGNSFFNLKLQVPGKHNTLNALASIIVADELNIPREKTLKALFEFQGVQRRFQLKGEINGVLLIDDYAHHPSEIRATLAAARERYPKNKIRAVFQPHRYSRVEDLMDQFIASFKKCDVVAVTDIYSAGEQPIIGVHSSNITKGILEENITEALYIETPLQAVRHMISQSAPGDIVITLGAGDLPHVYKELL